MAFASRLMNPTPFKVELNWDRGIVITIEPFHYADLTSQQMDDFKPGKPGSAEVRQILDYHGLFLLDTDKSYDIQALEALRRSRKAKEEQFRTGRQRLIDMRAATGVRQDDATLEDALKMMGYDGLREKIAALGEGIKKFEEVVKASGETTNRPQLDPARTVFVIDPPREFPSVAAMEFFLEKNPEVRKKHDAQKGKYKPRGVSAMPESQKFLRAEDAAEKEAAAEEETE